SSDLACATSTAAAVTTPASASTPGRSARPSPPPRLTERSTGPTQGGSGRTGRTLVRSLSNSPTREEASGERPVPRRHQPGADQAPRAADHPSRPASPPRLVLAGAPRLGHLRRVRPGRDLHGLSGQGL